MSIAEPTKIANFIGGGGGSTLQWRPIQGNAPLGDFRNSQLIYIFEDNQTGRLEGLLKVPESFGAGSQIKIKIVADSQSITDNFLLKTQTFLIRKNLDALDFSGNFHESSNTALANIAPINVSREIELDITNIDGEINGIEVNPGDRIRIQLFRDFGNDTDSNDIIFTPDLTEVLA